MPVTFYGEVHSDLQRKNSNRTCLLPLNGTFLKHYNEYYYFATSDVVMKHNDIILYRIEYRINVNGSFEYINKTYSEVLDLQKYLSTTTPKSYFDVRDFYRRKK